MYQFKLLLLHVEPTSSGKAWIFKREIDLQDYDLANILRINQRVDPNLTGNV